MDSSANLNVESQQRVELLGETVGTSRVDILFTGWPYRSDSDISIANAMATYFRRHFKSPANIFLDELARDTVGDAVCARLWCERRQPYAFVEVVTSTYHAPRSREIFNFVFKGFASVNVLGAGDNLKAAAQQEQASLLAFRETFADVEAGDMVQIVNRLTTSHPFYNGKVYPAMDFDYNVKTLIPRANEIF